MAIAEALLPEFDHEMANTRKSLERVPDTKFDFKPHPKSPTMGWLSGHIATIPGWTRETMERERFDMDKEGGPPPLPGSVKDVLETFDRNVALARGAIAAASDEQFMKPWSLVSGGKNILTLPRIGVLRGFVMNHIIHHRAQLGVYLRLNDIPVPALYGPSADEQGM